MTDTRGISQPLIAVVCTLGYIIISCIIVWIMCFITAARKGQKSDYSCLCFAWPIFVLMSPLVVLVGLWILLRQYRIPRTEVDILTLPFRPTELGMRLYIRREIRELTKLKKEKKNDEQ